ncbi:DUF4232 domain-containing protein [Streptomyces sp. NPDC048106]|uniref:DUF4232 domain-containing protein n=1 Tax=Streptomyces sp. NPDC048106 TaxID=3155750 RepID=UPI003453A12F
MRAIPLTVTAVAAALLLTACNGGGSGGSGGKDSSACRLGGGVSLQVGAASVAPAAGDAGEVPVSITNQSKTCTLANFPGVTLSEDGVSAKLPAQKGANAQTLKLAKGDAATFTIGYVRGKDGDATSLAATELKITLPGGDTVQSFPWKYGPIAGQGARTKPNASVSTFQQAGD